MSNPLLPDLTVLARPRLRFVQYDGRRRAIRIEQIYWQCLDDAAAALGLRLNQLVDMLANAQSGNLSALLRLFCVHHLTNRVRQERLVTRTANMATVMDSCPTPCFAIAEDQTIVLGNDGLRVWAAERTGAPIVGDHLNRHFRLKLKEPISRIWAEPARYATSVLTGTVAHMAPGSLRVRPVRACLIRGEGVEENQLLVFIL